MVAVPLDEATSNGRVWPASSGVGASRARAAQAAVTVRTTKLEGPYIGEVYGCKKRLSSVDAVGYQVLAIDLNGNWSLEFFTVASNWREATAVLRRANSLELCVSIPPDRASRGSILGEVCDL